MEKNCLILFFVIAFLACGNNQKSKNSFEEISSAKNVCPKNVLIENLLQSTLDIQNIQQYYPVEEVKKRGYLIIKKNEIINKGYDLEKLSKKVAFLSEEEIKQKKITAYIEFLKLKYSEDGASVEFIYPTQGLYCKAQFERDNCNWILKSAEIMER